MAQEPSITRYRKHGAAALLALGAPLAAAAPAAAHGNAHANAEGNQSAATANDFDSNGNTNTIRRSSFCSR